MSPDLLLFNAHVMEADFQIGVDKGMWEIYNDDSERPTWPVVYIWIAAAQKAFYPDRYYFHFDLKGYSATAPTAYPWDTETKTVLAPESWPKGKNIVSSTFNPKWKPDGQYALYAPCDRLAMVGHPNWQQQHPHLWWQPTFKITVYLNFIHLLLNSADYENS